MELGKLATFGMHDLAKRKKFEDGFDSDNDDEEDPLPRMELEIKLDMRNISNILHVVPPAVGPYYRVGAYSLGSNISGRTNTLYVDGNQDSDNERN